MSENKILIFNEIEALSQAAARHFVQISQEAAAARGRFVAALSGGGTPQQLFRLLAQPPFNFEVPWAQTHIFWGDERLVPPDDPGSNYGQAMRLLLSHVPIPQANLHRVKGELSADAAVSDYTNQLKTLARGGRAWPRFDLALMGLGSDGHTASLFPGAPSTQEKSQPVINCTAVYEDRPAHRLSLTPLVFNDARHVIFLVTGANKAETVTAVLNGPHRPDQLPAQRIQPGSGDVAWFLDNTAAAQILDQMMESRIDTR